MSLDTYIADVEQKLHKLLSDFKWDDVDWKKEPTAKGLVSCPIDPSHILDPKNLESHKVICALRKAGVDPDKTVVLESVEPFYKDLPGVVKLPQADKEPDALDRQQHQIAAAQQALFESILNPNLQPPITPNLLKPPGSQFPYAQSVPTGGIVGVKSLSEVGDLVVEEESATEVEDLKWNKRALVQDPLYVVQLENFAPLKAKRIVRRWKTIPANFKKLDWKVIDPKKAKGWLFANIDKYSKVIEEVEDINYIYNTFVETNDPDLVLAKLYDAVGKKNKTNGETFMEMGST